MNQYYTNMPVIVQYNPVREIVETVSEWREFANLSTEERAAKEKARKEYQELTPVQRLFVEQPR